MLNLYLDYMVFLFFSSLFTYYLFFFKKLILLLVFESLMILLLYLYSFVYTSSIISFVCMICFSVFLVLDSVFGICLLISNSRSSFSFNLNFNYF